MQSLFKSRKKRDSQSRSGDEISVANPETQRSPSGSSKSGDSPLQAPTVAQNATKPSTLPQLPTAQQATAALSENAQQAQQSAQQQAQHSLQQAQQHVKGKLNSPLFSGQPQNFTSQQPGQPGPPGQHTQHAPQHAQRHGLGQHTQLQPQGPRQGPTGPNANNGHNGPNLAYPTNATNAANQSQRNVPNVLGFPQSPNATVGIAAGAAGAGMSRYGGNNATEYTSPLLQPSDTPWAEYQIQRAVPSPRFGHSANFVTARDGELFIMGGIRDMDILNDLWVIDTNTLTGYQLVTGGATVGPRVGHAALVLGNAHVVFGGDTKLEESDPLDDNLYLLNTSSLRWTVAQPQGPRPMGRYGHSLSSIGACVYVFGGQVDESFFDDMWAFDLTTWRAPNAHWERIMPSTPPPPPRTNHTVVSWQDKLYLFGGANGDLWYSDTWVFDPATRAWEQLECSGYVPAPCQGHAATIIGDVMYIFGGMSSQGLLIDQLFALNLPTLKWYTFQNLGPGPSPRSGHSLTAFAGDKILVWGGTDQGNSAYVLDASRINYPDEPGAEGERATPSTPTTPAGTGSATSGSATSSSAAGAAGLAATSHAATSHAHGASSPGTSRGAPVSPQSNADVTSPPVGTHKEVRELQPHVYAPQSSETGGPTQARINQATRNSMLQSKRRSVLLPSSPLKDHLREQGQSQDASKHKDRNNKELHPVSEDEKHSFVGSSNTSGTGAGLGAASGAGALAAGAAGASGRYNSDRMSAVKSYVTDDMEADEKFVSAVDLNDKNKHHTRGSSSAAPPVPEEDSSELLPRTQPEQSHIPGSVPANGGPATHLTNAEASADSSRGVSGDKLREMNAGSDVSVKSGMAGWNSESDAVENNNASGMRRSHPQTNLSLQSIDDPVPTGGPTGNTSIGSQADTSIIAMSNEMSVSPSNSAAGNQASQAAAHAREAANRDLSDREEKSNELAADAASAAMGHQHTRIPSNVDSAVPNSASSPKSRDVSSGSGSNAPTSAGGPGIPRHSGQDEYLQGSSGFGTTSNLAAPAAAAALSVGASPGEHASELALLRRQLDSYRQRDFDDEHHKLKLSHTQLQRELADMRDSIGQLSHKHTVTSNQNTDLKQRCEQLEKQMGSHMNVIQSQQRALDEANAKLAHQQKEIAQASMLKSENADLKMRLETTESARKHAVEQLDAVNASYASLKSAHSDLSARHLAGKSAGSGSSDCKNGDDLLADLHQQVTHLSSMWQQYSLASPNAAALAAGGAGGSATSRGIDSVNNGGDFRTLYEQQKVAAERAHADLHTAVTEQAALKAQLRELSAIQSASPTSADLNQLKSTHRSALQDLENRHATHVDELDARHAKTLKDLQHHTDLIEDLRARLRKLETAHAELQAEYNKAIDLSHNQQVALTKTREELNMSRAHAQRLEEQLEDATLHTQSSNTTSEGPTVGDASHNSVLSGRNDQAALVVRDLRAQVVILEEEMQNQRDVIMRLKKAALNPH